MIHNLIKKGNQNKNEEGSKVEESTQPITGKFLFICCLFVRRICSANIWI